MLFGLAPKVKVKRLAGVFETRGPCIVFFERQGLMGKVAGYVRRNSLELTGFSVRRLSDLAPLSSEGRLKCRYARSGKFARPAADPRFASWQEYS
jgi:hypothetical protein